MDESEIRELVIIERIIFLLAPAFVTVYRMLYNQRRKMHVREKEFMQQKFNTEIALAQLEVQEQTMQTIGADLHDNIGQVDPTQPELLSKKLDSAVEQVTHSILELRLLGKLLDGDQLIAQGLDVALRQEVQWLEKAGKFQVEYKGGGITHN